MATRIVLFNQSDSWQSWQVPDGVGLLEIGMIGGGSGAIEAGRVFGKLQVEGGDTIFMQVGRSARTRSGTNGGAQTYFGGGAGGDAGSGRTGGNGGGGGTFLYHKRKSDQGSRGVLAAVAGGAGGTSGDSGDGGKGGTTTGQEGGRGSAGSTGNTTKSTGGTQNQAGKGGQSKSGGTFNGENATNGVGERGGKGGQATGRNSDGGGGGGGGFFAGGGGAASLVGSSAGGGGAGGSNYVGGLYSTSSFRGTGGIGDGQISITYDDAGGNLPPNPPSDVEIDGQAAVDGLATRSTGQINVSAKITDPAHEQNVKMIIQVADNSDMSGHWNVESALGPQDVRRVVNIRNLRQNTRYYLRLYTADQWGSVSQNYSSVNFWTNRSPTTNLLTPLDNTEITDLINVTFTWQHEDPDDDDDVQSAFRLRWREAASPGKPAGTWDVIEHVTTVETWTIGAGRFKSGVRYEWQVNTRDAQGLWGEWSEESRFLDVLLNIQTPIAQTPGNGEGMIAAQEIVFGWRYFSPSGAPQQRADIRYRVVGTTDWTILTGTTLAPGAGRRWAVSPDTFEAGFRYEWQVRVWAGGDDSSWSESETFWTVPAPMTGPGMSPLASGRPQNPLGVGRNRVFIYERGGKRQLGEIKNIDLVRWGRKRDDLSGAIVRVTKWNAEERQFYGALRTWQMEMVIFRNNGDGWKRAWEGPLTRIASNAGFLEIEAKCPMAYVYRRLLRQGYNDAYQVIDGIQTGLNSVVRRAQKIITNALAYDDPNLLSYLTPLNDHYDAKNSRTVSAMAKTAWEEIDDLAAHAGLDYTTAGRRIILWDTHRPVGRLPEMRDGDFSESPVVTEYGMNAANVFAVNSISGVWGLAYADLGVLNGDPGPEGYLEQLASAYGESDATATDLELSAVKQEEMRQSLIAQAYRNLAGRDPAPLLVRVPDNASLSPDLNIDINQLIPGVWIPLRSTGGVREVAQWQKLDSMTVEQTAEGEKVGVVMSPAPNSGEDPDDAAVVDE